MFNELEAAYQALNIAGEKYKRATTLTSEEYSEISVYWIDAVMSYNEAKYHYKAKREDPFWASMRGMSESLKKVLALVSRYSRVTWSA